MSNREAGVYILKTQRSSLKVERRMLAGMLETTPKHDPKHWDLIRQQESLDKELKRVSRRLRHTV
jgi:hypothetical protein